MIYGFVCHVSLRYYCYIQKQSSGGALRKTCSNKFRKFHKKTPALKTYWSCRSTEFNSIKREIPSQMLFYESWEICQKTFSKELSGRLPLQKHSFCLLSQHDVVPCIFHAYFPAEYFLGLSFKLGARVSSIFQTQS